MEIETKTKVNSYLTFKIGEEEFGANVSKVLNILELQEITKVPKAPVYMKGVINLRGMVLPVIDTRIKFDMEPIEFTNKTCILVLEVEVDGESVNVGALVDSVQEVLELDKEDIQSPPSIGNKYQSEFIFGMAKVDKEFIMLLDMDKVFSVDEITELSIDIPVVEDK
jgi:purine-binding chemotaxis protein CheW